VAASPTMLYRRLTRTSAQSSVRWRQLRSAALLVLLAAEVTALTLPFDASAVAASPTIWKHLLFEKAGDLRAVLITWSAATIFLTWPVVRDALLDTFRDPDPASWRRCRLWFVAHVMVLAPLIAGTALRGTPQLGEVEHPEIWLGAWLILAMLAVVTWCAAALPLQFWIRWVTRSPRAFPIGFAFGLATDIVANWLKALWSALAFSTLWASAALLSAVNRLAVYDPQNAVIGTSTFSVRVGLPCSGLEGISLVCGYFVLYLWICRREVRFPAALLLLPLGAAMAWILNAVRIAALVLLGSGNREIALRGFHSVAGWLFFNLVVLGMVSVSSRLSFLARTDQETERRVSRNPAGVYLVPLFAMITIAMLTKAFSADFDTYYPLHIIVGLGALSLYWNDLVRMRWVGSWPAVAIGAAVFGMWLALVPRDAGVDVAVATGLGALSRLGRMLWISSRLIGAIFVAPIVEELAFRGYLIRKLIASDFQSVMPGRFTWLSFLGSSLLFGILDGHWVAGTLAGGAFALALYRRGELSDAIAAHASANAVLAAYVIANHSWSLWA